MKVKFNGLMEDVKRGGCTSCGKAGISEKRFISTKSYFMPSGLQKTFIVGETYEVSERDGSFLLSYMETSKDGQRRIFEEV